MTTVQRQRAFLDSAEGLAVRAELQRMKADAAYNTPPSYTAKTLIYPDNQMPFVDKHMEYLCLHPQLDALTYLANLQLMTKIKHPVTR